MSLAALAGGQTKIEHDVENNFGNQLAIQRAHEQNPSRNATVKKQTRNVKYNKQVQKSELVVQLYELIEEAVYGSTIGKSSRTTNEEHGYE